MLYAYNLSPEKIYNLIFENFYVFGEDGISHDADIIYFYLSQKYGLTGVLKIIECLKNILSLSSTEIDQKMLDLANDD